MFQCIIRWPLELAVASSDLLLVSGCLFVCCGFEFTNFDFILLGLQVLLPHILLCLYSSGNLVVWNFELTLVQHKHRFQDSRNTHKKTLPFAYFQFLSHSLEGFFQDCTIIRNSARNLLFTHSFEIRPISSFYKAYIKYLNLVRLHGFTGLYRKSLKGSHSSEALMQNFSCIAYGHRLFLYSLWL